MEKWPRGSIKPLRISISSFRSRGYQIIEAVKSAISKVAEALRLEILQAPRSTTQRIKMKRMSVESVWELRKKGLQETMEDLMLLSVLVSAPALWV